MSKRESGHDLWDKRDPAYGPCGIRSWRLGVRIPMTLDASAKLVNPMVRGWINRYGRYHRSALIPVLHRLNVHLAKYKGRGEERAKKKYVPQVTSFSSAPYSSPVPPPSSHTSE